MSRGQARAAGGIGIGADVGYLLLIADQGADFAPRVVFLATFLAVMSALSFGGAVAASHDEVVAQSFLIAGATGLLEVGALAIASIGILLVLAGFLAFVAAGTRRLSWPVVTAISSVVTGVLVGGTVLT